MTTNTILLISGIITSFPTIVIAIITGGKGGYYNPKIKKYNFIGSIKNKSIIEIEELFDRNKYKQANGDPGIRLGLGLIPKNGVSNGSYKEDVFNVQYEVKKIRFKLKNIQPLFMYGDECIFVEIIGKHLKLYSCTEKYIPRRVLAKKGIQKRFFIKTQKLLGITKMLKKREHKKALKKMVLRIRPIALAERVPQKNNQNQLQTRWCECNNRGTERARC